MLAIAGLQEICDPRKTSHFWEGVACRILAGKLTDHRCSWDIEIDDDIRVEVKFSTAFDCAFTSGARRVFKFASLKGCGAEKKECDVLVLIGFDSPWIYSWVMPYSHVKKPAVTLSHPGERRSALGVSSRAFFDNYASCMSQMLPDVCRAYRVNDGIDWPGSPTRVQPDLFA